MKNPKKDLRGASKSNLMLLFKKKRGEFMKFLKERGFSMIQVMLAAGMVGGLSLAVMQLSQNASRVGVGADSKMDVVQLRSTVNALLANENFCRLSLAGKDSAGNPASDLDGTTISDIHFGKDNIDDQTGSGLPVQLYYGNQNGDARTKLKVGPGVKLGSLKISSAQLYMDNGTGPCSGDYCENLNHSDAGTLVVKYERKINAKTVREETEKFDVFVAMSTDSSNESTIQSCAIQPSLSLDCMVVRGPNSGNQDDDQSTAFCPAGYKITGCSVHGNWGNDGSFPKDSDNSCVGQFDGGGHGIDPYAVCCRITAGGGTTSTTTSSGGTTSGGSSGGSSGGIHGSSTGGAQMQN